jgi:hypothetical protein
VELLPSCSSLCVPGAHSGERGAKYRQGLLSAKG